jgi:hypothetical protein
MVLELMVVLMFTAVIPGECNYVRQGWPSIATDRSSYVVKERTPSGISRYCDDVYGDVTSDDANMLV